MTYPRRAPRPDLPARITAVHDVSATMRQIDLVGPDVPLAHTLAADNDTALCACRRIPEAEVIDV